MIIDEHSFKAFLPTEKINSRDELSDKLKIFDDGIIECWYAPLGKIKRNAKVIILGITPGNSQMIKAYNLRLGTNITGIRLRPMSKIAFFGSMRKNLVTMLDKLKISQVFNINSFENMFESEHLACSSILKYPIFYKKRPYNGHNPKINTHSFMKEMVETILMYELNSLNNCLIIPLGKAVQGTLECLESELQKQSHVLLKGFPHPSGANAHRTKQFAEEFTNLEKQIHQWTSELKKDN